MAVKENKWKWLETLLWAYSTIYVILIIIMFFFVSFAPAYKDGASAVKPAGTSVAGFVIAVMGIPALLHLLMNGIKKLK